MVEAKGCPLNGVCVSVWAGAEAPHTMVPFVNLGSRLQPWVSAEQVSWLFFGSQDPDQDSNFANFLLLPPHYGQH